MLKGDLHPTLKVLLVISLELQDVIKRQRHEDMLDSMSRGVRALQETLAVGLGLEIVEPEETEGLEDSFSVDEFDEWYDRVIGDA